MPVAYLSLGSNLGDRDHYLGMARADIQKHFQKVRFSQVYETEPVDLTDQPWFLNQVAEFETELSPKSLLEWARSLEAKAERQRDIPKGPRTLDVDILLVGDEVVEGPELILPHPRLEARRHVLAPLAELAARQVLPKSGRTVQEALEKVDDPTVVRLHV